MLNQYHFFAILLTITPLMIGCHKSVDHEVSVTLDGYPIQTIGLFEEKECKGELNHPVDVVRHRNNKQLPEYTHIKFFKSETISLISPSLLELSLCINQDNNWKQIWHSKHDHNYNRIAITCNNNETLDYWCTAKVDTST